MADTTPDKKIPPLRLVPVAFLDVETTGLDPKVHEIVEIAVVGLDGQVLLDTKVKPVNIGVATEEALKVNGYNEADWADAPTFDEIKDDVMAALKHKVVVGQNPQFDRNFVVEALARVGVEKAYRKVKRHTIDTITLAWEHLVPCGLDRLNLEAECNFLGIPLDRESRHGALPDAQAARTLYLMTLRATEEQRFAWRQRARDLGLVETPEATEPEAPGDAAAS
jgi:DNA polymerase III epsilon subunit-like protein